jgi:hypothetical protein
MALKRKKKAPKIRTVQLPLPDREARGQYCSWFQEPVAYSYLYPKLLSGSMRQSGV